MSAHSRAMVAARIAAFLYGVWGAFHIKVSHDIYLLGQSQAGIAQGRTYQLAAYLLTISLFVIVAAVVFAKSNSRRAYWLNLCVAGWADGIWVLVVVLPGYVNLARGLIPPAIFVAAALISLIAQKLDLERVA